MIKNIMSVDLEDFYCDLPFSKWDAYEGRVAKITRIILDIFEKYKARATFFVLGYIAEKNPELIEEVKTRGHEIASHGYSHTKVTKMTKQNFELDLLKSLGILRKISGEKILGYRAPFFSINKQNIWAFNIIKKYLSYDSSVFPVKPHYGLSEAPRYIYRMSDTNPWKEDPNSKFFEIPMTTLRLPGLGNVPVAGRPLFAASPKSLFEVGYQKVQ